MQCKKEDSKKKNELPAATQEGRNTFGFLLNGEVWRPEGKLLDQILDLSYDPSWMGGALSIKADQLISNGNVMNIAIGGIGISKPGTYNLTSYMNVYYSDSKNECSYDENSTVSGFITITRFDLSAKIISGTFHFKLEKDGCETIDATDGRFDMRIE